MNLERVIAVRNAKTLYRDGAGNVIKVFDKEYSKVDVLNEALNQALVENLSLNIPKIYGVEMVEEKWAIISEYIKGKTLAQLQEKVILGELKNEKELLKNEALKQKNSLTEI